MGAWRTVPDSKIIIGWEGWALASRYRVLCGRKGSSVLFFFVVGVGREGQGQE